MPTYVIPGAKAVENLKANPLSGWPSRRDAENRMEPLCEPGFSPGFHLEPGERVFTIGSCFARNIEKALAARGFEVTTIGLIERPTPLPGELEGWLETFAEAFISVLAEDERPAYVSEVKQALETELKDDEGRWWADYVRLRFSALKPG